MNPSKLSPSRQSLMPWLVWGLGCVFYFYECLLQVSPSVMSSELMRDFGVTSETLGILSGIYFYSYAGMQLPGGVLMDYFGPHRLLTIATTICAVSTIAFGMTENFLAACIARLMIGFGSAFAAVGTMKLAANWFHAERFSLLTGLMVTVGMIGAIFGEAPLALLIEHFGWRQSLVILGVIGLVIAMFILVLVKDNPIHPVNPEHKPRDEEMPIMQGLSKLIKDKQLWLVAVYGGLMYMATPVFCGLWGVLFLIYKMHLTKAVAANYIALVFVGWAIASPLWGIYSNRIGLRKPPMYIGCIGALCVCLLFLYAPIQTGWLMQILLFCFGIFSAGFLSAFAIAKERCDKDSVATGLSFMNMMNMIGIAIAQPLVGYILDKLWTGELENSIRVYSIGAYHNALAILPIGILISLMILPLIKETYCRNIHDPHH